MTTNGGERGPTGDHGQMGQTGQTGQDGRRGPEGVEGAEGAVGPEGPVGPAGKARSFFTKLQTLVVFGFVVLAGVAFGVRMEAQDRRIAHNTDRNVETTNAVALVQWKQCVAGVALAKEYNAAWRELAAVEETQTVDSALAQRRIAAYKRLILPERSVASCGPRP